jgi:insertion element IS1 protein InsB
VVICAEEDESSVDLDSLVSKDATSRGIRESRDRSEKTCRRLWEAIPHAYRTGQCYTDFWNAYQAVIPEEQHMAVGKETGETAHVERWNNTLRQRLARFVRKTLSFSTSLFMHDACLNLFLHRYNLERAAILM